MPGGLPPVGNPSVLRGARNDRPIFLRPALYHLWYGMRFLLPGPLLGPAGSPSLGPVPKKEKGPPLAVPLLPVLVLDKVQQDVIRLPHHVDFPSFRLPLALQLLGLPGAPPGYQALYGPDDVANDDVKEQ